MTHLLIKELSEDIDNEIPYQLEKKPCKLLNTDRHQFKDPCDF